MVVGDIASAFNGMPSFRPAPRPSGSTTRRGGGTMKSFVDGIMSPLVSCWQPPINSCVSGCAEPTSPRYGSETPAPVVSPLGDRQGPYHSHPASPIGSQPRNAPPTGYPNGEYGQSLESALFAKQTQSLTNIEKPTSNDVLCGRGGSSNRHLGNMHFRELVAANKKTYVGLTKKQKMLVARKIVEMVHNTSPPGRFLAKDLDTGLWYDIGLPRSLEKTSQALREKNSNDVPVSQQTVHDDALKDEKKEEEPASDPPVPPSKNKSSKNIEAPPITIPDHLTDVFGPRKPHQHDQESPNRRGPWPDYPPSSSSVHRHIDQPFLNSYPPSPTISSGGDPYSRQVPPRTPPGYPGHGEASPRPVHQSPYNHGSPDHREHYDQYHHRTPDRRDYYSAPSPRVDRSGASTMSPRLPPPPPPGHHHHRRHLPPPGPHRPPSQHYHHPPPGHHRPPPSSHHHRGHYGAAPALTPSVSHDCEYEYYNPPPPPPTHSHVYRSPNVRSKAEISPERRQEWKRQRNVDGVARRLSETSLTHAMEERLSLDERVVGREREHQRYHERLVHPPHCASSSIATSGGGRVVMGHRELLEQHRATRASAVEAPASNRDLMSPSNVLQSRSRRSLPITQRRSGPDAAAGANKSSSASSTANSNASTGESVDATKLSGLAALSTAAFLKLDESS